MSLSENAESLWGADSGVAEKTGAGEPALSKSEAINGMKKTRRAEQPPDELLTSLGQRPIKSDWALITSWMQALCLMSATINNL